MTAHPSTPRPARARLCLLLLALAFAAAACTTAPASDTPGTPPGDVAAQVTTVPVPPIPDPDASAAPTPGPGPTPPPSPAPLPTGPAVPSPTATPDPDGLHRPEWLHTRPLEIGPDGWALPQDTPAELVDRRIPTIDLLPPPTDDGFVATVEAVPDDVVARSTWTEECPVGLDELRYVTVSFWGFDDRHHTGELIVNASWAEEIVDVFRQLHAIRYPIEEMRIVSAAELEGPPTGDGNDTTAFVCRPVRGSSTWSQHAYGLAVDINPFVNPYQRGERILPELAGAYLDRDHVRPGMLAEGHVAVAAFDALGWGWGGRWNSLIDWMHFSANGR
ncbi:M15 family metallopeptidase [Euzebya pacifica]|uniref:M15 family metallopeptidase n=1 Tax=Euzebya pacifica TaxID=1608957 RepID=UPI001C1F6E4C|nr:M15 family metallopeptidase [Euzebya pacifica]